MHKKYSYDDSNAKLTRRERKALFALSVIIALLLLANIFYKQLFTNEYKPNKDTEAEISAYLDSVKMAEEERNIPIFFTFDPNTSPSDSIMQLSISKYVKSNIIRYRESGGKFRKKEDLKRIYGMTDSIYALLEAWIVIDKTATIETKAQKTVAEYQSIESVEVPKVETHTNKNSKELGNTKAAEKVFAKVELNSADTTILKALPGIGSSYARRIVKYRELLGGYYSVEQLKEVYGMKDEYYQRFAPHCSIDMNKIRKININFADYRELIRHPYIDKDMTQALLNYRNKNGSFTSIDKLLDVEGFDKIKFDRVKYYLSVE
ncbi:MAG: helix-hairpin-helix domain-containing protein [Bacteroidales bacterium]